MKTLDELKARKAELEKIIEDSYVGDSNLQEIRKHFPLGQVGHAGSNAKRLSKRQNANTEKVVQKAVEMKPYYEELKTVNHYIHLYESGHHSITKNLKESLQSRIDNMQVGGHVRHSWLNQVGRVIRVNEKSFRVTVGLRTETWKKSEINQAILPKQGDAQ